MFISPPDKEQDNTIFTQTPAKEIARINKDSVQKTLSVQSHAGAALKGSARERKDTTTVLYPVHFLNDSLCRRNSVSDVSFYDSTNFIRTIKIPGTDMTIPVLAEKSRIKETVYRETLVKHLRDGEKIPERPGNDWIILVIIAASLLFSAIGIKSKIIQPVRKFFLFRGTGEPASHDAGGLFHWQTTVLNLISFIVISIFGYEIASFNKVIPSNFSGMLAWVAILCAITLSFTARNVICAVTGNLSGKKDAFSEYIVTINQFYHFTALILFLPVVFIAYAIVFPSGILMTAGVAVVCLMYILRVIRLLIIFLNSNISIFYLILYLCALEILPVAIAIKYFTGLA